MLNNIIEISPLAYMRGRTFKNSFIIADEMQNSSPNQMKMLTTRIGVNSKIVITGDLKQSDIPINNGLEDLVNRIDKYNMKINNTLDIIKIVNFEKRDIERSEIVKNIINIYDYDDKSCNSYKNNNITSNDSNINNATLTNEIKQVNKIKHYNQNNNDAALIPKHHISKNSDIFFDNYFPL